MDVILGRSHQEKNICSQMVSENRVLGRIFGPELRTRGQETSKAIPLQAWRGPEGSRRLRLPDFRTIGTRRW
jgi:hypothetical protein